MQAKERGEGVGKEMYTLGLRLNVRQAQPVNIFYVFSHRSKTVYYFMYPKNTNLQFTNYYDFQTVPLRVTWEKCHILK